MSHTLSNHWRKQGVIFKPTGDLPWSQSHAQLPVPFLPAKSTSQATNAIRIYYTTRDNQNRSCISFIEVDKDNPSIILHRQETPVLTAGAPGTHDQDGVFASCVISPSSDSEEVWLYYMGISKGSTVPYRMSIGLSKSQDGGISFQRAFEGPILDRTRHEPYMVTGPMVIPPKEQSSEPWHMWYSSGVKWEEINGKLEPIYVIKYASSSDGEKWEQDNTTCIQQLHSLEANTRPTILKTSQGYHMWFCYRHSLDYRGGTGAYRLGYATSPDGICWKRKEDPEALRPTGTGFDAQMAAYPHVLESEDKLYIFYNGDGFGANGFGYAVCEKDNA